jgi:hypothetical protein
MKGVYITQPRLLLLKVYFQQLEKIWQTKTLSNFGDYHRTLEAGLKRLPEG